MAAFDSINTIDKKLIQIFSISLSKFLKASKSRHSAGGFHKGTLFQSFNMPGFNELTTLHESPVQ